LRLHPEEEWDKYFKTFRAWRHLALIASIWGGHEWRLWKIKPKNLTMLVKGIGKELRRRGERDEVLGDSFSKMTRLDLKREMR